MRKEVERVSCQDVHGYPFTRAYTCKEATKQKCIALARKLIDHLRPYVTGEKSKEGQLACELYS